MRTKYTEAMLDDNEKICVHCDIHIIFIYGFFLALFFIVTLSLLHESRNSSAVGFLICLPFAYKLLSLYFTEFVITNKKVVAKRGIVAIATDEIKNTKVGSLNIEQSVLGRIFGYGNLKFTGTGNQVVVFKNIKNPRHCKNQAEKIIFKDSHAD